MIDIPHHVINRSKMSIHQHGCFLLTLGFCVSSLTTIGRIDIINTKNPRWLHVSEHVRTILDCRRLQDRAYAQTLHLTFWLQTIEIKWI